MNRYTKPNVDLPVSLHDATVSTIQVTPASEGRCDGVITFTFEDGITTLFQPGGRQTGKAVVRFSGIDFDFCRVLYCARANRWEVSFEELEKDLRETSTLTLLDETYGYHSSKFGGYLVTEDTWNEVDMEIYHFHETEYEWDGEESRSENGPSHPRPEACASPS